jgi:hypothetical protein
MSLLLWDPIFLHIMIRLIIFAPGALTLADLAQSAHFSGFDNWNPCDRLDFDFSGWRLQ